MATSSLVTVLNALDIFLLEARAVDRDAAVGGIQKKLEKALEGAFEEQGDALMSAWDMLGAVIPDEFGDDVWGPWFEHAAEATAVSFIAPILAAAGAGLEAGAKQASVDLGIGLSFDLKNPRAVAYLEAHGAELVKGVNDTTREYIKTVVTDGVRDGKSYDQIAKEISARYEEFKVGKPQLHIDSRAHGIAVTEAGNAYVEGNAIVARDLQDAGLTMEKSWLTVGDDRVSPECQSNQDAGWIPFDDAFPSGHAQPLAHPYCRCDLLMRRVGAGGK